MLPWPTLCINAHADAEYVLLRSEATASVPEHVDAAKYAPIMCAGVSCFNSMRHMGLGPGDTVAIQGVGGLGHLAIQYARNMGFRVIVLSRGSAKEKIARELGAHEYIDTSKTDDTGAELRRLGGAKLIVAMAPTADSMPNLVKGLSFLGKLLILSVPGEITVNTAELVRLLRGHEWQA
jgi:D-arabinose 1-dehydrogenase-like Zn-dependent alcohol dehydrogenase